MSRRSKFTIRLEKEYGDKLKSKSKTSLSKFFKIPMSILNDVYDRGIGAARSQGMRPNVKSEDQWARARMNKLILNVMDVRAGKKKIPTGRGQDSDLIEKAVNKKN
tara:strand:+ start:1079 stop:1396 length:318 start_codon:yes stop_codon:yes gene_type:complete